MPYKTEKLALNSPFFDRRVKMLPCQRENVIHLYNRGASITGLGKMYKVNKRLIQFIIFPERAKRNVELKKERGGWKIYHNKKKYNTSMNIHRKYKHSILKPLTK